jgi:hypothetical protein
MPVKAFFLPAKWPPILEKTFPIPGPVRAFIQVNEYPSQTAEIELPILTSCLELPRWLSKMEHSRKYLREFGSIFSITRSCPILNFDQLNR